MPDLSVDEAEAIIAAGKQELHALAWAERANHAGHVIAASPLLDVAGTTIPGLTVVLEMRAGVFSDQCLYFFSLMKRTGDTSWRVYQLEVCPAAKRSHNGLEGPLYGPHEHVGTKVVPVTAPDVNCGNWQACLDYFIHRVSLAPIHIAPPC